MLTLATFEQLLLPAGQHAVGVAQVLDLSPTTLPRDIAALRKAFPPDVVAAAVETVQLRRRARGKWSLADHMYWEREALEQATGELVARHRATRYATHAGPIFDLCGHILGLVCSSLNIERIRAAGGNAENINFGIKGAIVRSFLDAFGIEPQLAGPSAPIGRAEMVRQARATIYRIGCTC